MIKASSAAISCSSTSSLGDHAAGMGGVVPEETDFDRELYDNQVRTAFSERGNLVSHCLIPSDMFGHQ